MFIPFNALYKADGRKGRDGDGDGKTDEKGEGAVSTATAASVGAVAGAGLNLADAVSHHRRKSAPAKPVPLSGELKGYSGQYPSMYDSFFDKEGVKQKVAAVEGAHDANDAAAKPWRDNLNDAQRRAVVDLQEGTPQIGVAQHLRGETANRNSVRAINETMAAYMPWQARGIIGNMDDALQSAALPNDVRTYRGLTGDYADKIGNLKPGATFRDANFTSTTLNDGMAEIYTRTPIDGGEADKRRTIVEYDLPKGHRAAYTSTKEYQGQAEVVLPRDQKLRVTGVETVDGVRRVRVAPVGKPKPNQAYALRNLGRGSIGSAVLGAGAGMFGGWAVNSAVDAYNGLTKFASFDELYKGR